jgi:hypothetical protein
MAGGPDHSHKPEPKHEKPEPKHEKPHHRPEPVDEDDIDESFF